jgi:hypothetical protein
MKGGRITSYLGLRLFDFRFAVLRIPTFVGLLSFRHCEVNVEEVEH